MRVNREHPVSLLPSRSIERWFLVAWLALSLTFLVLALQGIARHLRFEDALIVLRYARNLVMGDGFVFNPGERVLGVTTPLYTLISTVYVAVAGNAAPILQNLAGFAALTVQALLIGRLASRLSDGKTPSESNLMGLATGALAGALVLGNYNLNYLYAGMEVHLFVVLVLFAWERTFATVRAAEPRGDTDPRERKHAAILIGVVLGLAFLTRYDAALAALLIGVSLWVAWRRPPWRLTTTFFVVVSPWLLFANLYFGGFLPAPLAAKHGYHELGGYLFRVLLFQRTSFESLAGAFGAPTAWREPIAYVVALIILAGVVRLGLRKGSGWLTPERLAVWLFLLYPALHVAVYAVIGSDPGFTWHYYLVTPILWLLFAIGLRAILESLAKVAPRRAWLPTAVILVATVPPLVFALRGIARPYEADPLTRELHTVARWLDERYDDEVSLLNPAIGILGWETGMRIVDHAGLVTPGLYYFDGLDHTPLGDVLTEHRPDLVLLFGEEDPVLLQEGYRRVAAFDAISEMYGLYERRGLSVTP
ncbi:MAG: hypothetical protein AAGD38_12655 [Acidobacteriota bacterium]